jgi:hypothetical protein
LDKGGEGVAIGETRQLVEESQHPGLESRLQAFEKQAPEQPGERFDGEKEARPRRDPSRSVG